MLTSDTGRCFPLQAISEAPHCIMELLFNEFLPCVEGVFQSIKTLLFQKFTETEYKHNYYIQIGEQGGCQAQDDLVK